MSAGERVTLEISTATGKVLGVCPSPEECHAHYVRHAEYVPAADYDALSDGYADLSELHEAKSVANRGQAQEVIRLSKRVEELEGRPVLKSEWELAMTVVEAARSLVRAYRSATLYQRIGQPLGVLRNEDITSIARAERGILDALAALDKEGK